MTNSEKKILHLIPYASFGGTEKDCYHFIQASAGYRHEVWVLGKPGPMVHEWISAGAKVRCLNLLRESIAGFIHKLSVLADQELFHGILYWSTIRLPLIHFVFREFPGRIGVHLGNPIRLNRLHIIKDLVLSWWLRSSVPVKLFACSSYVLQTAIQHNYLKRFSVTVSLNPVKILEKNPHLVKKHERNGIVRLGMVARMYPIKDHATVIRAFRMIREEYPNSVLNLIGDGILRGRLENLAREEGIWDSVNFTGEREDVYDLLPQWDLFLYGTTPGEGLGNAVSEALANGLPVVASDLPMIREIIGDSGCAVLVEPHHPGAMAEAAIRLLGNFDLRKTLSDKSFSYASEKFSAIRYVNKRLDFLFSEK